MIKNFEKTVIPQKHLAEGQRLIRELNNIADTIREMAQVAMVSDAALVGAGREVMELSNRQAELYNRLEELSRDVD